MLIYNTNRTGWFTLSFLPYKLLLSISSLFSVLSTCINGNQDLWIRLGSVCVFDNKLLTHLALLG